MTSERQQHIQDYIRQHLKTYQDLALAIHERPETSNHEYFAQQVLSDQLEADGFTVVRDVAGHPTGFAARYKTGKPGPTVAFLAEFDALADVGHACGHNLYGNYALLAATALKQVIDSLGGEIRVYGTPGEEGGENGSAKGSFVRDRYFDDVDVALSAHPGFKFQRTSTLLANDPVDIEFFGKTSHAAAAPEKGVSALTPLIQTFVGIDQLRLHLPKDVSIHGVILDGGEAANVIPDYTRGRFYLRAATRETLNEVKEKVENIVKGAALATGTTYRFGLFQNAVDNMILTPAFDDLFFKHVAALGIPVEDINQGEIGGLGSSDVGNVSQVIPTIQPNVSISDTYIAGHSIEFREAARSDKGLASIGIAAELLARTALDLFEKEDLLAEIKADYEKNKQ